MGKLAILLLLAMAAAGCGEKEGEEQHTHDWGKWVVTTDPTTTTEGKETRTCTTCGATETKTVAKLAACTCNPAEHYLPCDCTGTDCTCDVIPRGYVTATAEWGNTNFPIYQSVGVENEQAITATQTIINAYDGLGGTYKITLAGANVEIWIVPSTETSSHVKDETGKIIMKVRWNNSDLQIITRFQNIVTQLLTP